MPKLLLLKKISSNFGHINIITVMQVFIVGSIYDTVMVLDKKRRHKQWVELQQIIDAIDGKKAWKNHPCTIQYREHKNWLLLYRTVIEYINMDMHEKAMGMSLIAESWRPKWHCKEYYDSMKSRLYTKDNDLISNQTEFQNAIEARLTDELGKENFLVAKVTTGIKYPQALVESINAKNRAHQEELRIKNEALVAEAEVAKKVAIAQGDAKALKIKGDAESEYNRKISASLSPLIVQQMMLDKWDGKLPTFTGGNGTMLDASKLLK